MNFIVRSAFMSMSLAWLLLTGCSKNETPVEEAIFTGLALKVLTVDSLQVRVIVDDKVLIDNLSVPHTTGISFPAQYFNPQYRTRFFEVFSNTLLLDTLLTYRPGYVNPFSFYQPEAGAKIKWLGPPVNEPLAPAGYGKVSIVYTYAPLADSLKVVVESSATDNNIYKPVDSFVLKKGVLSRYFEARNARTWSQLNFYTTGPERKLVAQVENTALYQMNKDYSIYLFQSNSSFGSVANLKADKLY